MIQVWTENNKLYTHKKDLKTWKFNAKLLSDDRFEALKKDREELLDLGTLLVMPRQNPGTEPYLLVLGGNQRKKVDDVLGREKIAIELIDFKQLEDGRWYVVSDLFQQPDGGFVGEVRTDLKSFATELAAMKTYSYKHNSQYAGYNPDELANDMDNPDLAEIDWSQVFANVGDPKSLQDYADRVAPEAQEQLEQVGEPTPPSPDTQIKTEENPEGVESTPSVSGKLVTCPDCGCEFDPHVVVQ